MKITKSKLWDLRVFEHTELEKTAHTHTRKKNNHNEIWSFEKKGKFFEFKETKENSQNLKKKL